MTDRGNDSALEALLEQVHQARGFRCEAYKESCLRRRLAVRMRACGVDTFVQYADRLRDDTTEYDRLLETLTINVTKFYRNAETWDVLVASVIPELVTRRGGAVKCWSAGCASGEEPYTLSVLLLEEAARAGVALPGPRCIDATDFDLRSLEKAKAGRYGTDAFSEMPGGLTAKYFRRERLEPDIFVASDEVRRLIRFSRHDVTKDAPPHPLYDLILFRNVVIYFDRPTQERIFTRMANALAPGGVFILGKVETLFGPAREMLHLEDVRERVYRRR